MANDPEARRVIECKEQGVPWRKWGPYLSERQWGTVREDYRYYGDAFTVECPTGSGQQMTLYAVAREIARRLVAIFLRDGAGRRPVLGGADKFHSDPH